MKKFELTEKLNEWIEEQRYQEYSRNTLRQYRLSVELFIGWVPEDEEITKDTTLRFKDYLTTVLKSTNSLNVRIVSLNKFFKWLGFKDLTLKKIKKQQKQSNEDVLSVADYKRLLRFAKREGKHKLYFIMKILAMTGIRISELRYFTVENLKEDYINVYNKGKERRIIIRSDLHKELRKYIRERKIKTGILFPSSVKPEKQMNESTIWRQMKQVAGHARIKKKKVHAHSFRHLFAVVFLDTYSGNIAELADILGHNSLETTRLYTKSTDVQKRKKMERLDFGKG